MAARPTAAARWSSGSGRSGRASCTSRRPSGTTWWEPPACASASSLRRRPQRSRRRARPGRRRARCRVATGARGRRRCPATTRGRGAAPSSAPKQRSVPAATTSRLSACRRPSSRALAAPQAGRSGRSSRSRCRCRFPARAAARPARTRHRGSPRSSGRCRRATCLGEEVELAVVGVGRMDDGGPWAQAACTGQELDRPDAVLLEALVDLARLLVGVDVERQALPLGIGADLLEPVGRAGADGVGGTADSRAGVAQLLELPEVLGRRVLPEPLDAPSRVGAEQEDDLDLGLPGRLDRGVCLRKTEVVELTHRRVAGGAELAVGLGILAAHCLRRLALGLRDHRLPPGPEVAARPAPAKRPLKRVAVRVHEARKRQSARLIHVDASSHVRHGLVSHACAAARYARSGEEAGGPSGPPGEGGEANYPLSGWPNESSRCASRRSRTP